MLNREAIWGRPPKMLTCSFCGWRGSELEADREMGDSDIEDSWHLYCPECGYPVGSSQFGLAEERVPGPWPNTPVASQGRRPRKGPAPRPNDPSDTAKEYEVNTGFLDPYRGNISTPEGWGPTRGQPAPRLKKKDKAPVMPADLQYYASKEGVMRKKAGSVPTECPNCGADWTQENAISMWPYDTDYTIGHVQTEQSDPEGIELVADSEAADVHIETIECFACNTMFHARDFDRGLWLLTK